MFHTSAIIAAVLLAGGPAPTEDVRIGSLVLSVSTSPTAQVFHIVDQLSDWSEFCHHQYARWASKALDLTEADRNLLHQHADLRRARGWGKGFEQAFYVSDPIDLAAKKAVDAGVLKANEAASERAILEHFAPKLAPLVEVRASDLDGFKKRLSTELLKFGPLLQKLGHLTGATEPVRVPVFLVANSEEGSSGGGFNGGRLVLEVQHRPDPMPTLIHESLHAFLSPHDKEIAKAAADAGLDQQTFSEGIAYALAPGLIHEGADGADMLAEYVAIDLLGGRSAKDSYVRFKLVALVIRPLLLAALENGVALPVFLSQASAKWRDVNGRR